MLDYDIRNSIVINTITTMWNAGQIKYLRSSGLTDGESRIFVEVHYYRERLPTDTGFHKDTVGETLFVNLNYLNDEEIAGPEYVLNPRDVPSHEKAIRRTLPHRFMSDLRKAKQGLPSAPKVGWAGNLSPYGIVTFTDELIHHATPYTERRSVSGTDLADYLRKKYLAYRAAETAADLALQFGVDRKAIEDGIMVTGDKRIPEPLFQLSRMPGRYNRTDLAKAGLEKDDIEALLAKNRAHTVNISGDRSEIVAPGQKALKRTVSELFVRASPNVPKQSLKPRSFFRTWVRAIRTPKK
jgi:hypothetical protein